ncbi:MAG: HAD family phosphatase [Acidimicrobiia bacterium]|nr:HAD family phosphatase [Acidimicrobiia bacterium]
MIKTVIFDLGGVIVPLDFSRAYRRMSELTSLGEDEVRGRIWGTDIGSRLECGQISARQFVDELGEMLDSKLDYEEFCELWSSIFFPETLIPESLLEAVKSRHRLLLLSNTNVMHFEMIRANYGLLRHFDHYVLSYEVGAVKPSPRIFEAAIEHARCEPGECFFTDDVQAFVDGARAAGIDAVQFQGYEQLRASMRERGIAV